MTYLYDMMYIYIAYYVEVVKSSENQLHVGHRIVGIYNGSLTHVRFYTFYTYACILAIRKHLVLKIYIYIYNIYQGRRLYIRYHHFFLSTYLTIMLIVCT